MLEPCHSPRKSSHNAGYGIPLSDKYSRLLSNEGLTDLKPHVVHMPHLKQVGRVNDPLKEEELVKERKRMAKVLKEWQDQTKGMERERK